MWEDLGKNLLFKFPQEPYDKEEREEEEIGAEDEDEGLKRGAAAVGFFWNIAAEIIPAFSFLFIGLEEGGSPNRGLLAG